MPFWSSLPPKQCAASRKIILLKINRPSTVNSHSFLIWTDPGVLIIFKHFFSRSLAEGRCFFSEYTSFLHHSRVRYRNLCDWIFIIYIYRLGKRQDYLRCEFLYMSQMIPSVEWKLGFQKFQISSMGWGRCGIKMKSAGVYNKSNVGLTGVMWEWLNVNLYIDVIDFNGMFHFIDYVTDENNIVLTASHILVCCKRGKFVENYVNFVWISYVLFVYLHLFIFQILSAIFNFNFLKGLNLDLDFTTFHSRSSLVIQRSSIFMNLVNKQNALWKRN